MKSHAHRDALYVGQRLKRRLIFVVCLCLVVYFFYNAPAQIEPEAQPPPDDKVPKEQVQQMMRKAIETDTQRLVTFHNMIWSLLGLSRDVARELSEIVNTTNTRVQHNKYEHPNFYDANSMIKPEKSSLSRDNFDANHDRRLTDAGVSPNAKAELMKIMGFIYRVLNDPNAYKDPSYDLEAANKIKILFENGPPPCCDERLYMKAEMQD